MSPYPSGESKGRTGHPRRNKSPTFVSGKSLTAAAKLPHNFQAAKRLRNMDSNSTQDDSDKPERYKAVRVWLADGTRVVGMWTGERWWSTKGQVTPARWELEPLKKKKKPKVTSSARKAMRNDWDEILTQGWFIIEVIERELPFALSISYLFLPVLALEDEGCFVTCRQGCGNEKVDFVTYTIGHDNPLAGSERCLLRTQERRGELWTRSRARRLRGRLPFAERWVRSCRNWLTR